MADEIMKHGGMGVSAKDVLGAALLALVCVSPAHAEAPNRITNITVYGDEPCPKGDGDEIVVCAREPEGEQYRIPKRLRETKKNDPPSQSWTARVRTLDEASRPMMPNSCSAVGSGGQTGCTMEMLRQWFAERQAAKARAADVP
ncbi:hypothetical protein [Sphingosinicella sp.]|uniref:hypothetical protein n=1 Tax=Sphingosinicella sp. TaxID=1917971 RepID=UPI0025CFE5D3|nr:hypothetical protein [Sphingosinicella sp.]